MLHVQIEMGELKATANEKEKAYQQQKALAERVRIDPLL